MLKHWIDNGSATVRTLVKALHRLEHVAEKTYPLSLHDESPETFAASAMERNLPIGNDKAVEEEHESSLLFGLDVARENRSESPLGTLAILWTALFPGIEDAPVDLLLKLSEQPSLLQKAVENACIPGWDNWKTLQDQCVSFDANRSNFILVCNSPPPQSLQHVSLLRQVVWKAIITLDPDSENTGLYKAFSMSGSMRECFELWMPEQIRNMKTFALARAIDWQKIPWLFANGRLEGAERNLPKRLRDWRANWLNPIGRFLEAVGEQLDKRKPLVIVIMPFLDAESRMLKSLLQRLDEVFSAQLLQAKHVLISTESATASLSIQRRVSSNLITCRVSANLICLGLTLSLCFASSGSELPTSSLKEARITEQEYLDLRNRLFILYNGCKLENTDSEEDSTISTSSVDNHGLEICFEHDQSDCNPALLSLLTETLAGNRRVNSVLTQCVENLEEICEDIGNKETTIISDRCFNCSLKWCLRCLHSSSCCSMKGCWDCGKRVDAHYDFNITEKTCCVACRCCTADEEMTNGMKKSAIIGSRLALTLVKRPSRCLLLFWRILELFFFIFSLVYAVLQGNEVLRNVSLVFSSINLSICVTINIIEWAKARQVWRKRNTRHYSDLEEKDRRMSERGGNIIHELMQKVLVYILVYPLLICDIYATFTQTNSNGTLKYVALGIGAALTVFDIYLHSAYMLVKAARDVEKTKTTMISEDSKSCLKWCCRIQWHVAAQIVWAMIIQGLIVATIAIEAKDNNKMSPLNVSTLGKYMMACGLVLPLLSIGLFVGANLFWIRGYFIDLFRKTCKEGISAGSVHKLGTVSNFYRTTSLHSLPECRFIDKIKMAFGDWRTIVFSITYFALIIVLVVLCVPVSLPVAISLAAVAFIANILAFLVALFGLFILAIYASIIGLLLAAFGIFVALLCVPALCGACCRKD